MGKEYEGVRLTELYCKANPNKVSQRYGRALIMRLGINHEGEPCAKRYVEWNKDYTPPEVKPEEDQEEERLLDE
jgi:hypothetical protein